MRQARKNSLPAGLPVTADAETDIGPRLRGLRRSRNLSLRALAARAGVTAASLSQIENGKHSPSVSTLKRILAPLNLTLGEFFNSETSADSGFVIRRERMVNIASGPGLRYLALPGSHRERTIQIMRETYQPGADTGPEPYTHAGEEAGFCITGSIEIAVGGRSEVLRPGDAYYFPSSIPHRWRNKGKTAAQLVSACAPPSF
jgi:transcriptional regulator with XRE-family HTH domain